MARNVLTTKLDFWTTHNKNVLFIGKHGVGKTAIVKDTFDRHKINYRYFSAATMDPWVDFVGVPREKTENKIPEQMEIIKELASISLDLAYEWVKNNWKMSNESAKKIVDHALIRKEGLTHLDLVRPADFAGGEVEALFFDEFNRSPNKIRNAVMELMQFKSINGFKFPNLRMVWAAINPDDADETYNVERLDPAQQDRFHVSVEIPYKPNAEWFRSEYGERVANASIQWWEELLPEEKLRISPRRLQYALDIFREHGDMRWVLPLESNVGKLSTALNSAPMNEKLASLLESKDVAEARSFLSNENNYTAAMKFIPKSETLMNYFIPLLQKEKMSSLMSEDDKMCNYIINNSDKVPVFMSVCREIIAANTNGRIVKKIRRTLTENDEISKAYASSNEWSVLKASDPHFNRWPLGYSVEFGAKPWGCVLAEIKSGINDAQGCQPPKRLMTIGIAVDFSKYNAAEKIAVYDKIVQSIPEKMTADEALCCLELLSDLFNGSFSFSSNLTTKPFEKLMGVVNHSISELHRNTGLSWGGILAKHGSHFKGLLEKIKLSGLGNRLHMPSDEELIKSMITT